MKEFLAKWRRRIPVLLLWLVFTAILYAIQVAPIAGQEPTGYRVGDIVQQDIRARDAVQYVSTYQTELERTRAAAAVSERFSPPDARVVREQSSKARQVLDYIDSVRADPYASRSQILSWMVAIDDPPISAELGQRLADLTDSDWKQVRNNVVKVIEQVMQGTVRQDRVDELKMSIPALVSPDLSMDLANVVSTLAQPFIVANSFPDPVLTQQAREEAGKAVQPIIRNIETGQIILRAGDRVNPDTLEALEQLGVRTVAAPWKLEVSAGLVAILLASLLTWASTSADYFLRYSDRVLAHSRKPLFLVILLFSVFIGVAKFVVLGHPMLPYLFPAAALGLLVGALVDPVLGGLAVITLGLLMGLLAGNSLELAAFTSISGLVGVISLGRAERLKSFFLAGTFISLIGLMIVLIFRLPNPDTDLSGLVQIAVSALANGGVTACLAVGGIYILGALFDITTSIQLYELARPNHPLLQMLLRNAPGSYHHSLMVGNLAEQACEQIGCNGLLVRVGAFYHDIGKIARPYFFIENQIDTVASNVHDRLDPHTSAEVLISHVRDGLDLGRRYKLPSRVRAFIPEHHGTTRVSFLYQKAVQQAGDTTLVEEKSFRYPGPRPQSKETALLMLADGCEAAVRSARPGSVEEIEQIVQKVIDDRVKQGQLDECGLTLQDLDRVRKSFVNTLKGMFHPRIKYPEPQPAPPAPEAMALETRTSSTAASPAVTDLPVQEQTPTGQEVALVPTSVPTSLTISQILHQGNSHE